MTTKTLKNSLYALSALSMLAATAPSQAGDYQLWRHQVSTTSQAASFQLADSESATAPADYLLWRNQVPAATNQVFKQNVAHTAGNGEATLPNHLFWREQVSPGSGTEQQREVAMESAGRATSKQ